MTTPLDGSDTPIWSGRLRAAGALLPLAAGIACSLVDQSLLLAAWIPFTFGAIGAALLRSWWAVLVAPAALSLGVLSGLAAAGRGSSGSGHPGFALGLALFVILAVVPAATGAAIGAPLGKELERTVGPHA
ncbi:MAG TPA: hypothetical protein VMS64_08945 [Candidatus Methylomirabilis sp.]|nr:hypothetical protein [Candidatus Methylomirabilis sp.]